MRKITTQAELDAAGSEWVRVQSGRFVARDSSHVVAWNSSHVVARDSSHVVAWNSSHVEARDSSHVVARNSSHVVARDSSHVVARDSSHVEAWDFATVSRQSDNVVATTGPSAVCVRAVYPSSVLDWAAMKGIAVNGKRLRLWKAVSDDGTDFFSGKINYLSQETEAPDWDEKYDRECGAGLHLADSPSGARCFVQDSARDTFRLLEVSVAVDDCSCFPGRPDYPMKLRARACRFEREVARDYEVPHEAT